MSSSLKSMGRSFGSGSTPSLRAIPVSFGPVSMRFLLSCWTPRPGCSSCCRCCRRAATGRARSSRGGLGVGERTVRRDVERLRALGYPVRARRGVAGGYRLEAGASLPPLLLDEGEAVAVAVGLRTRPAPAWPGSRRRRCARSPSSSRCCPTACAARVAAIGSATVPYPGSGPQVDGATLADDRLRLPRPRADPLRLPQRRAASRAGARRSRSASCTRAGAGTWSPGTPAAPTGARSGWTASSAGVEAAGRFVPRTPPAAGPRRLRLRRGRPPPATATRRGCCCTRRSPRSRRACRRRSARSRPSTRRPRCCAPGSDWLGGLAVYVAEIGVDFTVLDPPEFAERVRRLAERFARAVEP